MIELTKRQTELILMFIDKQILENSQIITDTDLKKKLDNETTLLRGFTNELLQLCDKLSKQPTGGSK
jgi:hypothetical protein